MGVWPSSLRSRLAVLFAVGAGVLLAGSSLFLWRNLTDELDQAVTAGLRQRAADVSADVAGGGADGGAVVSEVLDREPFAQVVSAGTVVGSSPNLRGRAPVITTGEERRASTDSFTIDRSVAGLGRRSRLLVEAAPGSQPSAVVVIGTSLDANVRAQRRLRLVLAATSPVLLGLLAAAGWLLAGAALRPVRRMTEEAAAISLAEPGRRLAQPPGDDEIALLGRTLNNMLDRIEAAVAHERRFLDDASHELRTPVAILRAELELALLDADDAAARSSIQSALEEAEHLARMADDLLVLARSDAGRLSAGRGGAVVVADAADVVAAHLGAGDGREIRVIRDGDTPAAADATAVDQILTNLVANARRFATSIVQVTVRGRSDGVVIEVSDDGPGFPGDLLPRAFDRFARSDLARGRDGGGAGLGLAIVAALVRSLGGTVTAANGPPLGGASVRVTLPAAPPSA